MAKRNKRSQADDAPTAQPIERRAPSRRSTAPATASELPQIPEPGDAADRAEREIEMLDEATLEVAAGLEPTEEDIRLRAYHRYLQRGGSDGAQFDDWIEAERELKKK